MDKKLIRNLSCIIFCFMVTLVFVPQTVDAKAAKPMFYNVHYNETGPNDGGWMSSVSKLYYSRCNRILDTEPTRNLQNPSFQKLFIKMHEAKYVNIVAFGKDLNSEYESKLTKSMLIKVKELPKNYFCNIKMCYLGMGSHRLAEVLIDKGVQCVIYGGASGYQSQREMVRWFNGYFVLLDNDADTALKLAKKKHEHDRGPHNAYRISSIKIVGNKMVKYN